MSGPELGLAIIGTVDLCFKYGSQLMRLCAAFKGAAEELRERVVRIETGWHKIATQLEFMRRVEGLMDTRLKEMNERAVYSLESKLKIVTSKLEKAVNIRDGDDLNSSAESSTVITPRRWKYALSKEGIDKSIEELETWQQILDPSWYLIMMIANSHIDQALTNDNHNTITAFPATRTIRAGLQDIDSEESAIMFLPASELEKMTITDIPFCDALTATRTSTRKGFQHLILTRVECPPHMKVQALKRDLRDLARKLTHNNPTDFNILSCKGVIEQIHPQNPTEVNFIVVFRTPSDLSSPRSLRGLLVSEIEEIDLSDKFNIAKQMATSINYVHTFGFVHKNFRPETIIVFSGPVAFLMGFSNFRKDEGKTYRISDDHWEKNLYRHPSRQGLEPSDEYVMQHDIYSLGVCLLELGLGRSFITYTDHNGNPVSAPASLLQSSIKDPLGPEALKSRLITLAHEELPRYMGRRYAAVVKTCLTCLDHDNTDFGDEKDLVDSDGVLVGVRYIEKVLSRLNEICV
ncbi:hypothetical protein F4777DRAFT_535833 [Nemania sp. FL0916]|nr:hypothetical protein F4777DRAFT_535833 [Nemania sp. FL0916]